MDIVTDAPEPALRHGRLLTCKAHSPLDGTVPGRVWIVVRGGVDVFGVRRDEDGRDGPRHPLFRAAAGQVIFGLPAAMDEDGGQVRLVLVGDLDAQVHETTVDALLAETGGVDAGGIDSWLVALLAVLLDEPDSWPVHVATKPGPVPLRPHEPLFGPPRAILWARALSGCVRWRARDRQSVELAPGSALPLSGGVSVEADGAADLCLETTEELAANGTLVAAVEGFHRLAGRSLGAWVGARQDAEYSRLTHRHEQDRRVRDSTLRRVNAVLAGRPPEPMSAPTEQRPPLVEAFLRVAQNRGMAVGSLAGPLPERANTEDRVQALARLMGARARRVLLRGSWWTEEAGPLIAFLGEDRDPVALLPHGAAGYRLVPAHGGDGVVVDETLAETLAADAYSLYVPLPPLARRVRDLLGMAGRPAMGDLLRVLGMGLLAALLALAAPVVTGYLIDTVIPRAEVQRVGEAALALVLIALGATVFRGVQAMGILRAEGKIDHIGQAALVQRLLTLPTAFFRSYAVGDLADRCLGFQHIRRILTGTPLQALLQGVFSTVSIGLMFYYDWRLALIACAVLGAVSALIGAFTVAQRRARADMVRWQGRIDGLTVQLLNAIGKVRIAAAEERAFARWFSLVINQKECLRRAQCWANWAETLAGVTPIICTGVVFLGLAMLLREMGWDAALFTLVPHADAHGLDAAPSAFTAGDFMAFNAAFGQAIAGYLLLARALPELIEAGPYLERLRPILEVEPEASDSRTVHASLSGAVTLSHVTFRYHRHGAPVIDDVSLDIESGTFVALVGPSGGGKSTLVRLLLGFETPDSGIVAYDGVSLDQLDLTAMRTQVGVVLQNGRVNQGTMAENIIGTSGASLEDAWTAARMAGLADDIEAMPMGMHTVLVEGARTLSGGQRQRLLLARALVGRPRLVILDEATSALDNRVQEVVTASLDQLRCTRIVIAHRLSTIMNADKIVVVDGGRVIETGTYDALMAADGVFKAMVMRQLI